MKKKLFFVSKILLLLAIVIIPLAPVLAQGKTIYVADGEVINDAYHIRAGDSVELRGLVLGDIVVAGGTLNISGEVKGDIIAAGGNVKVSGPVGGNIRIAGGQVEINGPVEKNILVFGGNVILGEKSDVQGGILAFGGNMELRGHVQKKARIFAGSLTVTGKLDDNLEAYVGDDTESFLVIYPTAKIEGDVTYTSLEKMNIHDGAQIKGEVIHKIPKEALIKIKKRKLILGLYGIGWLVSKIFSFLSMLVIGFALLIAAPKLFIKMKNEMHKKPLTKMGYGFIYLILIPVIAFLLVFTIIGIPLSFIIVSLYLICLMIVKIFVSYTIGHKLFEIFDIPNKNKFAVFSFGLVVFILLISIPFIGWPAKFVLTIWGLGALVEFKKVEMKKYK